MKSEAAIIVGAVDAVVVAVIALVAWVLGWETEVAALLVAALQSVVVLVGAIVIRSQVYSQATVDEMFAAAVEGNKEDSE